MWCDLTKKDSNLTIEQGDETMTDEIKIANAFNDFFSAKIVA